MATLAERPVQIRRAIDLGEDGARVVLYAWSASDEPRTENLVRLDADGSVRWRAPLPAGSSPDCFVDVKREGRAITAFTWGGISVHLDPATGEEALTHDR